MLDKSKTKSNDTNKRVGRHVGHFEGKCPIFAITARPVSPVAKHYRAKNLLCFVFNYLLCI